MSPILTPLKSGLWLVVFLLAVQSISCQDPSVKEQATADYQLIVSWNETAYRIANDHDGFMSFIGVRALAMTHLAIHDVLNTLEPAFQRFLFHGESEAVSPIAASSQAAFEVLLVAYPNRKDTLEKVLNHWLSKVEDGEAKEEAIRLGKTVALQLIAHRDGDGHEKNGQYTPMTKPGDYQYTPGFDYVWKPDFSYATPFVLDSVTQFRSPAPPSLDSKAYLASFDEVKAYGGKVSQVRTEDQTHFAHWWAEFGEHSWNRLGRIIAKDKKMTGVATNRMFALINVALYDLYLVSFDSKYHFDTWRPYTAIREADKDNNPDTKAEADWEPEMMTPPWPEYPSAHAAVGASGATILSAILGTSKYSFTMPSTTALEAQPNRSYKDLMKASDDCADSRIMNGFHFRFATEEGKIQGKKVAEFVLSNILQAL